jgi:hypothetical protein
MALAGKSITPAFVGTAAVEVYAWQEEKLKT